MMVPQPIYRPLANLSILSIWQKQLTAATHDPKLRIQLAQQESTLFPQFAAHYQRLASLPRRTRRRLQHAWKRSLAGVALLLALGQGQTLAAMIDVDGACTLADAIITANTNSVFGGCSSGNIGTDTIVLPANSTQTLAVADNTTYGPTGLPVISSEITIQGNGSTIQRDSSAPPFRILTVNNSGDLTLQQTTITGGHIPDEAAYYTHNNGGGIANYGGNPTLTDSTVSGNTAADSGGGVYNNGTLTLVNSTVSGNMATIFGSGIANLSGATTLTHSTVSDNTVTVFGGGVASLLGATTLTHSTVSGNTAFIGGGVLNFTNPMTLTNSTVSGNTSDYGGGIFNAIGSALTLEYTLVSGNTASDGAEVYSYASTISANNYNLFGHSGLSSAQAFEGFIPSGVDIIATSDGVHPTALGAILQVDDTGAPTLQSNGGLTRTIALVADSPAINVIPSINCPPPPTDQRDYPRPVDGDRSGTMECDIGAIEFGVNLLNDQLTFTPISSTFTTTGPGTRGCPVTFHRGTLSFEARLTNKSASPSFLNLGIQVVALASGNELLLDATTGITGNASATMPVPTTGDYADQVLSPGEQVIMPFTVCLQSLQPSAFFVDVFGQEE